ncbi:MAG: trigger factor [Eubacteriales bacterium]|nr:trigger factor [Eubacteriales bacterium]
MSVKVENLEKNMAKLTVEVSAAELDNAIDIAYKKNKNRFNIPGFRKGKVPMAMVEKMYGPQVFYEDAVDTILNYSYPDAAKESGLEIVSRPEIDIVTIEKGKPFVYTATVATKPEVELGQYKGVKVSKADVSVTAKDVEAELVRVQEQNARMITVDDAEYQIKNGDTVTIDFDGSVDGVAFEGGKGENYPLTIGSHSFIDNFEDQLVGHKTGDNVDVNVTFPTPYGAKELEGKAALFKVVIHEIKQKELPALDDDFASEVSEFETLKEYKASLKSDIKLRKEKAAAQENENNVVKAVVANAKVELPDAMVNTNVENMINDYERSMNQQGLKLEQYLSYLGQTPEQFIESLKPQAIENIKSQLVFEAIIKAENITATDEAVEAKIKEMAEQYKMEADKVKGLLGEGGIENIKRDICFHEAIDLCVAEAELVDEKKAKKAAAKKEEAKEETKED